VSSALFIDPTTSENGPLRVLPRSHLRDWPIQDEWPPLVKPESVPESDVIDVLAPAGSILIFHSALVHSSSENRTDEPRRLMIYSHHPSTFEIEPDKRNRVLRERSEEHERRYKELVASGPYKPAFRMN
jgi:ectoine hydroxylase-related dioxygenase (phytanoyl-CoA dioxygenase family)